MRRRRYAHRDGGPVRRAPYRLPFRTFDGRIEGALVRRVRCTHRLLLSRRGA